LERRSASIAAGPLGDHVDAIVHGLTELLGDPHTLAAPVPSARSTFALDVTPDAVPEPVARRTRGKPHDLDRHRLRHAAQARAPARSG
jgi:hypothetical protein